MIFLTGIKVIPSNINSIMLILFMFFKSLKLNTNSIKPLYSEFINFNLSVIEFLLTNYLISYVEIFVESLSFWDEMGWYWVWSEDFSRVNVLVVTTDSLLESSVFDWFLVFHCCSCWTGTWSNTIKAGSCVDLTIWWFHFNFNYKILILLFIY